MKILPLIFGKFDTVACVYAKWPWKRLVFSIVL